MKTNLKVRTRNIRRRLMGFLTVTFPLLLLASVFSGYTQAKTDRTTISPSILLPPEEALFLEQNLGIQIMSIRSSSGGRMIDFRYKVIDAKKAQRMMNPNEKPYLLDPVSGVKFFVPSYPKIGSMRAVSSNPIVGRVYYILFSDRGGIINTGKAMTVVIGDFRIENLVIQ